MGTTTFSTTVSGNYTITSTTSGVAFTLYGTAVPSGSTITSVNLNMTRIAAYSAMRLYNVASGGVAISANQTTSGSQNVENVTIPLFGNIPLTGGSVSISFRGAGRGSASADGNVMGIRDGCVLTITVYYNEPTVEPPVEPPPSQNNPPNSPTINAPVANGIIYNPRPRVLITIGSDPKSLAQSISASGYTASRSGYLPVGSKLVLMRTANLTSDSSVSISILSTNTNGMTSTAATRSFNYRAPSFANSALTQNASYVKGVDMRELRAMVANIAAYYGVSAPNWGGEIMDGQTSLGEWTNHVLAIRNVIGSIVNYVNGWDAVATSNKITLPAWITIPENRPRVDVMIQLRAAISLL